MRPQLPAVFFCIEVRQLRAGLLPLTYIQVRGLWEWMLAVHQYYLPAVCCPLPVLLHVLQGVLVVHAGVPAMLQSVTVLSL